jgi:hypothetical protein
MYPVNQKPNQTNPKAFREKQSISRKKKKKLSDDPPNWMDSDLSETKLKSFVPKEERPIIACDQESVTHNNVSAELLEQKQKSLKKNLYIGDVKTGATDESVTDTAPHTHLSTKPKSLKKK